MTLAAILRPDGLVMYRPPGLHIPDGVLSPAVALACWLLALAVIGLATRQLRFESSERELPLVGVVAAFVFAAQMINFPVLGGTSGHLVGGALAATLVGPWAAMLAMTAVIGVQGLLFQDGGLLSMGANILNMGLLPAAIGFGAYRAVADRSWPVRRAIVGVAAWLSVLAAALLTSLQLWISGTAALRAVLPAMLGFHALVGIGECAITVAALSFIQRVRPDLLSTREVRERGGRGWVAAGLALATGVLVLAPWASTSPDGLESVAATLGLTPAQPGAGFAPLPDYSVPLLGQGALSTIAAGGAGVAVVVLTLMAAVALLGRHRGSS